MTVDFKSTTLEPLVTQTRVVQFRREAAEKIGLASALPHPMVQFNSTIWLRQFKIYIDKKFDISGQ
jgi:hypothetical protein